MQQERFTYLFNRFADKKHTASEKQELMELINSGEYEQAFHDLVSERWDHLSVESDKNERADKLFERIMGRVKVKKRSLYRMVTTAAAVILLFFAGGYFYFFRDKTVQPAPAAPMVKNDRAPGGNKATLTMADGQQIILDKAKKGLLSQQGNIKIIKLEEGQVTYTGVGTEVLLNTITTPKGGQYQIVLADGSKVLLNAASSLQFPAFFTGKERNVVLRGEGYFEVAKNTEMPFHVQVNEVRVEVLGTHFNVNAYEEEETIRTTLLEGSVKLIKNSHSKIIKPGQQAVLRQDQEDISITDIGVDDVVAWKNGKFQFDEGADIPTVMRQIARWYDVDIEDQGKITGHLGGTISRNVNASQVFKMLEMTGSVKFLITGKKVIVMQ
jgi:ferric-dicitrate binding protein FerR (iron transport regulator)